MMKLLQNRTVLITGCNRGIGRAIMEIFMDEGANIVACARKQTSNLNEFYAQCEAQKKIKIYPLYFDLLDENAIKAGMKQLYALHLTVDVLVNNAGMLNTDGLLRLKIDNAHKVMQVNFFSTILITQSVIKLMLSSDFPSIINITSVAALKPTVGNTVYGASKAALISMTTCWAKELASAKIRVNAIAPGYIDTDINQQIDDTILNGLIADTCLKRLGKAEEIAKIALFLASKESSFIDGEIITAGGGFRI